MKVLPRSESSVVGALACLADPQARSEAFASLIELNAECLELLVLQARVAGQTPAAPVLCHLADQWCSLSDRARLRAAACPYLLVDLGFSDPNRWRGLKTAQRVPTNRPFFTGDRARGTARRVFVYGWHLAQSHNAAAQVLLGIPEHCADLIAARTLSQIHELAEQYPQWMTPRWPTVVGFWRDLLFAAESGKLTPLQSARMRGLRLLAAERRIAQLRKEPGPARAAVNRSRNKPRIDRRPIGGGGVRQVDQTTGASV